MYVYMYIIVYTERDRSIPFYPNAFIFFAQVCILVAERHSPKDKLTPDSKYLCIHVYVCVYRERHIDSVLSERIYFLCSGLRLSG